MGLEPVSATGQDRLAVVAIERRSSLSYLDAVFATHAAGEIAFALDPAAAAPPGLTIARRVATTSGGGWFEHAIAPRDDDAPAQIVLTSGTTGVPKPILLGHRALADTVRRLVEVMQLDATVREYVGVPVDYSFGFGRIRAIAAVGGRSYLPEHGFRVDELAGMLARGEVNALSAVPTLLRTVIDQRHRFAEHGEALRRLEIGSQAMTAAEKDAVRAIFPAARIVQHYGLTEASRTTFLDLAGADPLDSVGRPNGAVELKITDDGLIAIRGPHLASGRIEEDGAIAPLTDAEGWLVTRDEGHLTGDALFFDGRADDLINVAGIKVSPDRFEELLALELGSATGFTVAAGQEPLRGEVAVVAFEPSLDAARVTRATAAVAAAMKIGDGFALLPVAQLPRTATGKVQRRELTALFAAAPQIVAAPAKISAPSADGSDAVTDAFVATFGSAGREPAASFNSLDGDSLNYLVMLTALEQAVPNLPEDWTDRTVGELSGLASNQATGEAEDAVAAAFAEMFGEAGRDENASFNSLGGDSLNYLMMLSALERAIPELPDDWADQSLGTLSAIARSEEQQVEVPARRRYIPANADTVRGVACGLVVALHVVGVDATDGLKIPESSTWHSVMDALDLIRMPLFTALAGFLYGALPARNGFWPFIRRKGEQLFLPLLFVTFALHAWTYGPTESIVTAYVWGYRHLWYINAILLIFAFVGFVDARFSPGWRTWAAIIALIVVGFWAVPDIRIWHFRNAVALLPYFLLGLLLYRVPQILERRVLALGALAVVLGIVALQQLAPATFAALYPARTLIFLCGGCSVVAMLRLFPKVRPIELIAPYTFTIYLWHPVANAMIRNPLQKLGLHSIPLLFVIGLVSGLTIPIILHIVARKFPRWVYAPIIG